MSVFLCKNRVYFTKAKENEAQSAAGENADPDEGQLKTDAPSQSISNNPQNPPPHPDNGQNIPPNSSNQNQLVYHDYLANVLNEQTTNRAHQGTECKQSRGQRLKDFLQRNWKIIAVASAVAFCSIIVVLAAVGTANSGNVAGNLCVNDYPKINVKFC